MITKRDKYNNLGQQSIEENKKKTNRITNIQGSRLVFQLQTKLDYKASSQFSPKKSSQSAGAS